MLFQPNGRFRRQITSYAETIFLQPKDKHQIIVLNMLFNRKMPFGDKCHSSIKNSKKHLCM